MVEHIVGSCVRQCRRLEGRWLSVVGGARFFWGTEKGLGQHYLAPSFYLAVTLSIRRLFFVLGDSDECAT